MMMLIGIFDICVFVCVLSVTMCRRTAVSQRTLSERGNLH